MNKPTAACTFPGKPGPAGHIPACQLCPNSPTYWRDQPASPTPTVTAGPTPPPPSAAGGLDWSKHRSGDPAPCRVCRKPAFMRDAAGKPCHKVCAEQEATR